MGNKGAVNPISIYTFTLNHRDVTVKVKYEFGNFNLAEVEFVVPAEIKVSEFKLETKDNFSRWFSFNKSFWEIKSESTLFTSKLMDVLRQSSLTNLANDTSFEPIMSGINNLQTYTFSTKFYLGFTNKEDSIIPVIEFHKQIIDLIRDST